MVQPRHGSFPELVEWTGGGVLVQPNSHEALAEGVEELMKDGPRRQELGRRGMARVHESFSAQTMARETRTVYEQFV